MIAAQGPIPADAVALSRSARSAGAEARALALAYLRSLSAAWRGDARAAVFPLRLSAYRRGELPAAPKTVPDAISPHGGAGRGMAWYQAGDDVLGNVPGSDGGYRVPISAVPRLVRCAPVGDRDTPRGPAAARPADRVSA